MLDKPLHDIRAADIDALMSTPVAEGKLIEYKLELPGKKDEDKKEFLADVSSFANTNGGYLLFGIDEAKGVPVDIVGVDLTDADAAVARLDNLIVNGIAPRIRYAVRRLTYSTDKELLLIRVEQSWNGPQRVTQQGHDKFYARNSVGKYPLDVGELREAFLRSSTVIDRIRQFHEERIREIAVGRTPVPMGDGAKLLLHLVPMSAFASTTQFDVEPFYNRPNELRVMSADAWQHRVTVEGLLTYSALAHGVPSYSHLYRNGVIEAVDGFVLNREIDGKKFIPSGSYEQRLIEFTGRFLALQHTIGVTPPVYLYVTLINAIGCWMGVVDGLLEMAERYPIDRAVLDLPGTGLHDLGADPAALLRPMLDVVWNACGYMRSQNFDAQGTWAPRR